MLCTLSFEECGAILIRRQSLAASLFCLQAENILSLCALFLLTFLEQELDLDAIKRCTLEPNGLM